ncbi:Na-translocating system protein MpsC family protein, partial [Staphylococcus aureus]
MKRTKGEIEAEISKAITQWEKDFLGRGSLSVKRRTKNAKAFHDKCENPGNWDTRLLYCFDNERSNRNI